MFFRYYFPQQEQVFGWAWVCTGWPRLDPGGPPNQIQENNMDVDK